MEEIKISNEEWGDEYILYKHEDAFNKILHLSNGSMVPPVKYVVKTGIYVAQGSIKIHNLETNKEVYLSKGRYHIIDKQYYCIHSLKDSTIIVEWSMKV